MASKDGVNVLFCSLGQRGGNREFQTDSLQFIVVDFFFFSSVSFFTEK